MTAGHSPDDLQVVGIPDERVVSGNIQQTKDEVSLPTTFVQHCSPSCSKKKNIVHLRLRLRVDTKAVHMPHFIAFYFTHLGTLFVCLSISSYTYC
jgi:hypothetical protein